MASDKVTSLAARRIKVDTEAQFLDFIHADIEARPAAAVPLGRSIFDRIDALEQKANANLAAERMEG
jgi:hypothetical protein